MLEGFDEFRQTDDVVERDIDHQEDQQSCEDVLQPRDKFNGKRPTYDRFDEGEHNVTAV